MAELRSVVDTAVSPDRLWAAITDWSNQHRWIPLTHTRLVDGPDGEGAKLEAWTGVRPVAFLDTMTIDVWQPPQHLVLRHTGKVVKGSAGFDIEPVGTGSRLTWWETVEVPFGAVGRVLWVVAAPVGNLILRWCLHRVAKLAAG